MTQIGRAFVAVVPPDAVLTAIDARVSPFRSSEHDARWVPREQWHLTVQFLGRVNDEDELAASLRAALDRIPPFAMRLGGSGAFPNPRRASVVWVGVREGGEALATLAGAVNATTESVGFALEQRAFRPHVTVARFAKRGPVDNIVSGLDDVDLGPAWLVEELVLFESRTRPSGAEHHVRARLPLAQTRT
jgi:2'-5' RNA ligase